jgi:hypothetical protein
LIDLLYLCHGRIEFTEASLTTLIANTNWGLVNSFVVYNDAAPDLNETTKMLVEDFGLKDNLRCTNLASPVGVMNHFLWRSQAEMFAKIDNDIMVPPGWLEAMLSVMDHDPQLDLLGMEAGMSAVRAPDTPVECYTSTPCSHIGGVGLMRRRPFDTLDWPRPNGRFGFTEWQHHHRSVQCGWIEPDLRMFSLDQIPFEPWLRITKGYKETDGLQRNWEPYPDDMNWYWDWANLAHEEVAA